MMIKSSYILTLSQDYESSNWWQVKQFTDDKHTAQLSTFLQVCD